MKSIYKIGLTLLLIVASFSVPKAQWSSDRCTECAQLFQQNITVVSETFRQQCQQIVPWFGQDSGSFIATSNGYAMAIYQLASFIFNFLNVDTRNAGSWLGISVGMMYSAEVFWVDMNELTSSYNNVTAQLDREFCECLIRWGCANGCQNL
jgi:hypothetical protein